MNLELFWFKLWWPQSEYLSLNPIRGGETFMVNLGKLYNFFHENISF